MEKKKKMAQQVRDRKKWNTYTDLVSTLVRNFTLAVSSRYNSCCLLLSKANTEYSLHV